MQGFIQTLRGLGAVRLAAMGAVGLALVVFFVFMSTKMSSTDNAILFGNLDPADSSKIVGKLETMGVPYEMKAEGRQVWVPADKVLRLRMNMAEEGLPSGGSMGYELFDRTDTLGSTNFVQNVNLIRALEGELARTIRSIGTVAEARVHLVMPKRELFSRTEREPTASVLIRPRGTERLNKAQVRAIQHLVAAAVPGLSPARISVVDSRGELLARGSGSDGQGAAAGGESADDARRAYEDRMTRVIEELLENSVGAGKVRAEVTAEMDFDRITTNSETYDPNGQVVRSTQSVEETSSDSDLKSKPAVTVRNNLPDANAQQGGAGNNKSESATSRTEETVNYEISKTVKSHVREIGTLKRVSVAVLVDGTYSMQGGKPVYQPRSPEEIENLAKLVRSAVGYDDKRGDKVELINLQFAAGPREEEKIESPLFGLTKADYFRIAELLVLAVVAILVLLLVIRPIVQRTLEALPTALSREHERNLLADQSVGAPALTGPAGTGTDSQEEEMIDVAQVEGRVRASIIKKIGEIVEHHPEETVSIIREWLYQDA